MWLSWLFFTPHRDGTNALLYLLVPTHTHYRFVTCLKIKNFNLSNATGQFTCITDNFKKNQPSRLSHQDMCNLRYKSLIFARSQDTLARWCLGNHPNIWGNLLLCWKVAAMSSEHFWSWKSHACDLAKVGRYIYISSWIVDSLSVSFYSIQEPLDLPTRHNVVKLPFIPWEEYSISLSTLDKQRLSNPHHTRAATSQNPGKGMTFLGRRA